MSWSATRTAGIARRCAQRGDLSIRRSIERVVFELRTDIAKICQEMADGELSFDDGRLVCIAAIAWPQRISHRK
jgi:hypothetical protein